MRMVVEYRDVARMCRAVAERAASTASGDALRAMAEHYDRVADAMAAQRSPAE